MSLHFDKFYEPVSVIEWVGKKRRIVNLTPELINAWIKHVYCSSKTRMVNFERGALSELSEERLLTAMSLIRGHMEASGMACLCHNELRNWVETSDDVSIRELIPPTFLGTSMVRAQKKDKDIEDQLFLSEQDKVPIGRMISALDEFMTLGNAAGKAHGFYGLLCEFTHPNLRAVRDHTDTQEHPVEGWYHCYNFDANLSTDHYLMALEMLLLSMKAGHGICEMLCRTQSVQDNDRGMLHFPNNDELREIWETYLAYSKRDGNV
jgi:hypothetical protein